MSTRIYQQPRPLVGIFTLIALTVAAGCGDDSTSSTATTATSSSSSSSSGAGGGSGGSGGSGGGATSAFVLTFEGRVGDKVFDCNATYPGLGAGTTEVKITDFRLYVHDIRLHKAGTGEEVPVELDQDGLWQHKNLALLDFEDKTGSCSNGTVEKNTVVHATAPSGAYDGISFKLGVPFELNHADVAVAPSPLNLSALFWNWNGGYKFLRVDSVPVAGGTPFNLHLGSTGCTPMNGDVTSCDRPNIVDVAFKTFDPAKSKIVIDYAMAVFDNDVSMDMGGAPGCMSGVMDPDCAAVFARLGIDISDGSIDPDTQTFFHME